MKNQRKEVQIKFPTIYLVTCLIQQGAAILKTVWRKIQSKGGNLDSYKYLANNKVVTLKAVSKIGLLILDC